MAITPGPGWMVDPNNPNGVIPIGSSASVNNPNASLISTGSATPTSGTVSRTSSTPAQTVAAQQAGTGLGSAAYTNSLLQSASQKTGIPAQTFAPAGTTSITPPPPVAPPITTTPAPTTPIPTNADITRNGLLQTQANTAATNPLSDPNNPLVANLKSAQDAYQALQSNIATQFGKMETSDQALPVVLGQEGALQKQYAGQLDALAQKVNSAQTALGQAVSAYSAQTGAQNAATSQTQPGNQFMQVPYSNQIIGANGQPVTGGSIGSLPPAAQDAVALQIGRVQSGLSTVADAENALSAYGQPAVNALQEGLGSNFSTITSNANASAQTANIQQTQGQSQQTQQAVSYANKVLDDLTSKYANLAPAQTTSIPLINTIANFGSQLFGAGLGNTQAYSNSLQEARAAISAALVSSGSVTPSNAGSLSASMLPDNATPTQIKAAKAELQNLLSQRQGVYTSLPGAVQSNTTGGVTTPATSSLYSF